MPPLFSAILPVLHADDKLGKTLDSIEAQEFPAMEVLIMDGAASPATEALVKEHSLHRSGILQYHNGLDKGIYDAMNRGVELARGRYLYFIGAGDALLPKALTTISHLLPQDDRTLLYGNVTRGAEVYDGEFDPWRLCHRNICQQAAFYGREIFEIAGNFSDLYPACADWEFHMRCFAEPQIPKRYVAELIADFERGGRSSQGDPAFNRDHARLIRRHLGWLPGLRWAAGVLKMRLLSKMRGE